MKSKSMLAYEGTLPPALQAVATLLDPYGLSIMDEPAEGQLGQRSRRYDVITYQRSGNVIVHRHVAEVLNHETEQPLAFRFWRPYGEQATLSTPEFLAKIVGITRTVRRYGVVADDEINGVLFYRGALDLSGYNSRYVTTSLKQAAAVHLLRIDAEVKNRLLERGVKVADLRQYEGMPTSYIKTLFSIG